MNNNKMKELYRNVPYIILFIDILLLSIFFLFCEFESDNGLTILAIIPYLFSIFYYCFRDYRYIYNKIILSLAAILLSYIYVVIAHLDEKYFYIIPSIFFIINSILQGVILYKVYKNRFISILISTILLVNVIFALKGIEYIFYCIMFLFFVRFI